MKHCFTLAAQDMEPVVDYFLSQTLRRSIMAMQVCKVGVDHGGASKPNMEPWGLTLMYPLPPTQPGKNLPDMRVKRRTARKV